MQPSNLPVPDVSALRSALRQQGVAARKALPPETHAALSAAIEAHLMPILGARARGQLAFCWPYQAEFDARPLVTRLLTQGWQLCLPVVVDAGQPLHFRNWTPDTPMQADRYGIATPQTGAVVQPDVVLLPFNALDKQGYRLGYGAGYFDRTLAALSPRPYVIGVGFGLALTDTVWPQAHDIPVDIAVTEAGILNVR